jgi:hypothetical protein
MFSTEEQVSRTKVTIFIAFMCWKTIKIKHTMKLYNNAETGALETARNKVKMQYFWAMVWNVPS